MCNEDSDCPPGEPVLTGHGEVLSVPGVGEGPWRGKFLAWPLFRPAGVRTGRCLHNKNMTEGTCEIFGWCPLESECVPE